MSQNTLFFWRQGDDFYLGFSTKVSSSEWKIEFNIFLWGILIEKW